MASTITCSITKEIMGEFQSILVVIPIGALQKGFGSVTFGTIDQLPFGIIVISVGALCFSTFNGGKLVIILARF